MNNLLEVKLKYNREKNKSIPGARNLRVINETSVEKIDSLISDLERVVSYYKSVDPLIKGYLIDIKYNDIIAKSNRVARLLKPSGKTPNDAVVGARFSDVSMGEEKHIITYYVDSETLQLTIEAMNEAKRFLNEEMNGRATAESFNEPGCKLSYDDYSLKKTGIRDVIVDCSVVEGFSIPDVSTNEKRDTILITFFRTERRLSDLLDILKVDRFYSFYGEDTISVPWNLYKDIEKKVPYMISMISEDWAKLSLNEVIESDLTVPSIPLPKNEPTIGVIDSLFDEGVYFSKWVGNEDVLDEIEGNRENFDCEHGTQVSSIIVDGPALNPWLDDGCGRFKVRHFGVCKDRISVPRLVRKIVKIVDENPDIHVWNLSLGTNEEISRNFISYDASVLDELQARKNVIFVISGTNDNRKEKKGMLRVGSPADSMNAVVVNSVKRNGKPASYTRKGTVLSFFNKPDVSFYGGDYENEERIMACSSHNRLEKVYGTSFAAPWISRKLCYLIDVMGLPREVAKALIIDSAAGWNYKMETEKKRNQIGYGVVPIDIRNIMSSEDCEIKILLYGTAQTYKTSNYQIPVPRDSENKYPYVAKATLCYFPECSRLQGVDYTSRELSMKFGRVKKDGTISDINENIQDESDSYIDERQSRRDFRKWENTKFISSILKQRKKPLMSYPDMMWGLAVYSKERLKSEMKDDLNFGVVITLRELTGRNRIQDFITACTLRGWIVNEIDVKNRIEVYNSNQETIVWD